MSTELNYEILIKGNGKAVYNDIGYCSFFRCPISKTASIVRVRLSMDQIDIRDLMNSCAAHKFQSLNLKIYCSGRETKKRTTLMYETELICLNVIPDHPLDYKDIQMHVSLELVHPTLHTLGTDNSYNIIKYNMTAYDILKDYEKYLSKTFKVFDEKKSFKHLGADDDKNEYKYEHILIKTKNDLEVPNYLLNTYKTHNVPFLYFFDNFYFNKKETKDITCHYMNISDKKYFEKEDIKEYGDSSFLTKLLEERPLTDINNMLNKNNPVLNTNHRTIAFDQTKTPQTKVPFKEDKGSGEKVKLYENREIKSLESGKKIETKEQNKQITSTNLVVPDKIAEAKKRLTKTQEVYNKVISCNTFEITNAVPDFPQFGKLYNLDVTDRDLFTHVPINIVNVFMRQQSQRDPYLKLVNRVLTLKYSSD